MARKFSNLFNDVISGDLIEAKDNFENVMMNKLSVFLEKKKKEVLLGDNDEDLDAVGKEDDDVDNDGDSDSSDDYLKKRRAAIGKAMKKEGKRLKDIKNPIVGLSAIGGPSIKR